MRGEAPHVSLKRAINSKTSIAHWHVALNATQALGLPRKSPLAARDAKAQTLEGKVDALHDLGLLGFRNSAQRDIDKLEAQIKALASTRWHNTLPLWKKRREAPDIASLKMALNEAPQRPDLVSLPHGSKQILDAYPVTRWWGRARAPPLNGAAPPLPRLYKRFDWMLHLAVSWSRCDDPRAVWVLPIRGARGLELEPRALLLCRDIAWRLGQLILLHEMLVNRSVPRNPAARVLVCAGEDTHFARLREEVRRVKPWFARIFYEALDAREDGVYPMPIGLQEHYFREQTKAYETISLPPPQRPPKQMGAARLARHMKPRHSVMQPFVGESRC